MVTEDPPHPASVAHELPTRYAGITVYGHVGMAHAGYAHRFDTPPSITLREGLCRILEKPQVTRGFANALYVLCHEMGHILLATDDEMAADNYALGHFRLVALRFGIRRKDLGKLWRLCPYS